MSSKFFVPGILALSLALFFIVSNTGGDTASRQLAAISAQAPRLQIVPTTGKAQASSVGNEIVFRTTERGAVKLNLALLKSPESAIAVDFLKKASQGSGAAFSWVRRLFEFQTRASKRINNIVIPPYAGSLGKDLDGIFVLKVQAGPLLDMNGILKVLRDDTENILYAELSPIAHASRNPSKRIEMLDMSASPLSSRGLVSDSCCVEAYVACITDVCLAQGKTGADFGNCAFTCQYVGSAGAAQASVFALQDCRMGNVPQCVGKTTGGD